MGCGYRVIVTCRVSLYTITIRKCFMNITLNNATAILEECLYNGSIGRDNLYAWFLGEKTSIEDVLFDLISFIEEPERKE